MSRIEKYRDGTGVHQREMWNKNDIAEYCGISLKKADKLHMIANKACGVVGYGDIEKEDFIEFYEQVEAAKESQRLIDEANAASILFAQKNYFFGQVSFFISQAISLLTNH